MKQVTLGHEDIEWDRPESDDDRYQAMLTDDVAFMAYVSSCEYLDEPLERAHRFHRMIANQLIAEGVGCRPRGNWAGRTIVLCHLAKRRRDQTRDWFSRVYGKPALRLELDRLETLYPRAIWGESL